MTGPCRMFGRKCTQSPGASHELKHAPCIAERDSLSSQPGEGPGCPYTHQALKLQAAAGILATRPPGNGGGLLK